MSVQQMYVIPVHGWAGSPRVWDFVSWPDDWTVLPYELPGHGTRRDDNPAGPDAPFTIPAAGEDLADFIRRNVPAGKRALLIGHSMGGQLTLHVHVHHPELVAGEVVIDPALGAKADEVAGQPVMLKALRDDACDTIESFIQGAFSAYTPQRMREAVVADIRRADPRALADYYQSEYMDPESFGNWDPAIAMMKRRTKPTLGIYTTPARADFERTAGTRDVSIWSGGHGHFLFLEDPVRFADEVVSWAISRGVYENVGAELRLVTAASTGTSLS
ncbi:alpha/beta fold hydrolase [Bifidobacterium aerophilum]|uniref:Alpha/beta fold hydrolase n=1 Tax=Bifidobacterium aerophilum TaxID=1798155 RepID=A0A6N9Z223_9BIFI|nr:alpha/beta hydrolase [Bifidobacterium aerophilum]NEG88526.1 alpha/beta fold hydrolase [Bifidobacterium aerophilum]